MLVFGDVDEAPLTSIYLLYWRSYCSNKWHGAAALGTRVACLEWSWAFLRPALCGVTRMRVVDEDRVEAANSVRRCKRAAACRSN